MTHQDADTICAVATPAGTGGVGIIRVSGPGVTTICEAVINHLTPPRQAKFSNFHDATGEIIDSGIALFFKGPQSFTGEDVLELQAHGGPVILSLLLKRVLSLGARQARPGEFSERAFLNPGEFSERAFLNRLKGPCRACSREKLNQSSKP
jgi:tRNA modification GTPase